MVLRRGMTVDDLKVAFERLGIVHTRRSHEGRLDRGTFECAYFLQLMVATQSVIPPYWAQALSNADSDIDGVGKFDWELACVEIFTLECQAALYQDKLELSNNSVGRKVAIKRLLSDVQRARGQVAFMDLMYLSLFAPMIGFEVFLSSHEVVMAEREMPFRPSPTPPSS